MKNQFLQSSSHANLKSNMENSYNYEANISSNSKFLAKYRNHIEAGDQ